MANSDSIQSGSDDDAVSAMTPPASVQSSPGTPPSAISRPSEDDYAALPTRVGNLTTRFEPAPGQPVTVTQSAPKNNHEMPTMVGPSKTGSKPSAPSAPASGMRFDTMPGQYDSLLPDSAVDYVPKTDTSERDKFIASVRSRIDPKEPPTQLLSEPDLIRAEKIDVDHYSCPLLDQIALIRRLGEGGNGTVFLGYQRLFGEVAVKTLKLSIVQYDASIVSRFFLEARLSKKLSSPHIVKTFDARKEAGLNFLVMEYIHGIDASRFQKQFAKPGQPSLVPEKEALRICIAACKGLKMLHDNGVMHRDIKPQNIMIPFGRTKEELRFDDAKLMDLGLARTDENEGQSVVRHDDEKTVQGTLLGTPGFMSPEQVLDCSSVAAQSDVFSMGATLYCLVCGVPPFREMMGPQATAAATVHSSHVSVNEHSTKNKSKLSRGLITIIEQCLCKKPEERYASASDLLDDMVRVLEGKEPYAKQRRRKISKNTMWFGAGVAAALILGGVFAYKAFFGPELASHLNLINQAKEAVKKQDFEGAQDLINQATLIRLQSKKAKDPNIIARETEVNALIKDEQDKLKKSFDTSISNFRKYVKDEDFVRANAELDGLKEVLKGKEEQLKQYLPEKTETLQGELDAAKRNRQLRFDKALQDTQQALNKLDFASADRTIEVARAIDEKNATVVQLGKDIRRIKAETAIEDAVKNGGDLDGARTRLDEIKQIEPGHASIAMLGDKIAKEDAHRKLLANIDKELSALDAGAGDLGNVTPLVEKLASDDPTRKPREEKAKSARAEFDKFIANAKQHLDSNSDVPVAEEALKSAEKIWRTNAELPSLQKSMLEANNKFESLIQSVKADFVKKLSDAETKLATARQMKPREASLKDCDALIAGEKAFRGRLDKLEAALGEVDKIENFDVVGKEVDACLGVRNDERTAAAKAQYDTKYKAYQEKLRAASIAKWSSDLTALGPFGDGSAYDAIEKRLNEIAAAVPNDPRNVQMRTAYQSKWDIEEAKSVIGHAGRLKKATEDYQGGVLGLKELETKLIASETTFPGEKAFAKQRELVDRVKGELKQKVASVSDLISKSADLDRAIALLDEVTKAYPNFEGTAQADKALTELKSTYDKETKTLSPKLAAGEELEKIGERIQKCSQMFPRDAASQALVQKMADWKESFKKSIASVNAGAESGNLEAAKKDLDKAALLFPSDAQIPKLDKEIKDQTDSVQKELVEVEKFLDKNVFVEIGSFPKASDDVTRFVRRLPSDAGVARVDGKRQKIIKETEALIPEIEKALASPFTVYETMSQTRDKISRVNQVLPDDPKLAGLQKKYAAGKSDYENRENAKANTPKPKPEDTKTTKTEGPDSF